MMNHDDEDEDEDDVAGTWTPQPPDDDNYEDPNPRAIVHVPEPERPVAAAARAKSARQQHEEMIGGMLRELLERAGVAGMLAVLLEELANRPVEVHATCSSCGHVMAPFYKSCPKCEGDRNRRKVDRVAELVREMKQLAVDGDPSPSREREIMHQLREYDHPDVDGLERWCRAARDKAERAGARNISSSRSATRDRW